MNQQQYKLNSKRRLAALSGLFLTLLCVSLVGCIKAPEYDDTPFIEFRGLSSSSVIQNSSDSVIVTIYFTDGDGDLGSETLQNVTFTNTNLNIVENTFRIPVIPQEGASPGISGEISFTVLSSCCVYSDGTPPCFPNPGNTYDVNYDVQIEDRAGNMSNVISLPPITHICN